MSPLVRAGPFLVLGLLAAPLAATAQPATKISRIGQIWPGAPSSEPSAAINGLREGLRDLGHIEGQTIAIESRWAQGKFERLPDLAADLVRRKVDVIVVIGTSPTRAAKQATGTILIISISDPRTATA